MPFFCAGIPQRWIFVLFGGLGFFIVYSTRISLSITLTQMVGPIKSNNSNLTHANNVSSSTSTAFKGGTFDWSESTQGVLLSSFYWGYILTQIPAGLVAERFGAKYTLGLSILATALLNAVTPYAIWWGGLTTFIATRAMMGLFCGVLYPASNVLLSNWIPQAEKSRAGVFVYSGAALGTVFATCASGIILEYWSWPMVFYFFGAMGVIWSLLFLVFCYDTPQEHPFITIEEVRFLKENLSKHKHEKRAPVPWRHMLTSAPVWALIIASTGQNWGTMTLANDLNKYMSSVLKLSVMDNGYLSAIPAMCTYLVSIAFSILSDWLISSKRMTSTNVTKLGVTIASIGPAIFLTGASYAGENKTLVMTMITIGAAFFGCAMGSITVNVLDLSPNYAGTLMALKNELASGAGLFTAMVAGFLTPTQSAEEWRTVFWVMFAILLLSNAVHLMYASGEVQEWNDPDFSKKRKANIAVVNEELHLLSINGKAKNSDGLHRIELNGR